MGEPHNTYIDSACNYITHALNTPGKLMDRRYMNLTRTLITIAAILALAGAASATDHYVATWGDNNARGNIEHPWQNVSYATQQAVAGDTIYLFDGTWYDEHAFFANSGNATHPITLTAYNGTPTLDGMDKTEYGLYLDFNDYIEISHLTIRRYYHTIYTPGSYIHISDCDLSDTGGVVMVLSQYSSTHNTIENCALYDSGWNTIQVTGNREPPDGNGIPATHITIRNCTIYNSAIHCAIDLYGNFQHVTIENNELYNNPAGCIYTHDGLDHREYVTIRDNNFHDTLSIPIDIDVTTYVKIYNNTFRNIYRDGSKIEAIYIAGGSDNYMIYNNSFYDCGGPKISGGYNFTFDNNYIHDKSGMYNFANGAKGIVKNPSDIMEIHIGDPSGTAELLFEDGTVFTAGYYWLDSYVPVRYYPEKSNTLGVAKPGDWGTINTVTPYNITLRPTHGHLYDVTVDTWDKVTGTHRITASSTEPYNPTWINLTTKTASATYNIAKDGESCTQATTSADGVLRYRYTGTWDGPHTFKISYAGGVDPVPCVTNIRRDAPTQNAITLRWDCPVQDIDYYTIRKDGTLLGTTVNKYYSANNLVPDTAYTFAVSATKDGTTGDSVDITVKTAAEDCDPNIVIIAKDTTASRGGYVDVPITLHDATGVACYGVNLTYDASVVAVTSVTQGDFTTYFGYDGGSAADGWVTVNTYVSETSLNGDVKIADLTLKAVGAAGDTSPLEMELISMADQNGYQVSGIVSNGLFTVIGDTSHPAITDPSASQLIPDDTDGVPSWGETATLNVTVTCDSGIAGVTIDLSAIGGLPVQPMRYIGNNVWSVTTNASAGTPPRTYNLPVCATDTKGYTNMHGSVELVVMRNGDVTGDNDVTPDDVALLANYVTYPGRYTISSEFVADVTDDGVVNIADAMMLANYVASPDRRTLRFEGDPD